MSAQTTLRERALRLPEGPSRLAIENVLVDGQRYRMRAAGLSKTGKFIDAALDLARAERLERVCEMALQYRETQP